MATVKEARKTAFIGLKPDDHVAVAVWTSQDVFSRAEERWITITQEQADAIIDMIDRKLDASIGISWDTIDFYLDELPESIAEALSWRS